MKTVDFIIVGQGIAGTCLAWNLLEKGKKVLVIDDCYPLASSRVATGIFHPFAFKTLTLSWKAGEIIPLAKLFYEQLEGRLKNQYLTPAPLYKLFYSVGERRQWELMMSEGNYKKYLAGIVEKHELPGINMPFGAAVIAQAGRVDMHRIILDYGIALNEQDMLLNEKFDHYSFAINSNHIEYKGYTADRIIFCEGQSAHTNPYFQWLPFVPAKGELLTIKAKKLKLSAVVKGKVFLLPLSGDLYRVGTTYEWEDNTTFPTKAARTDLTKRVKQTINAPFKIIEQTAGIRPTVRDRRPFIGPHPEIPSLWIFNGLGTKGAALAPYFAEQLANHLTRGTPIDKEASINRYLRFFEQPTTAE